MTAGSVAVADAKRDGRIVALRMGPTWSLWWMPRDAMGKDGVQAEQWKLLTKLASPTNATVTKPTDDVDKAK
jgi:hypothetical protein